MTNSPQALEGIRVLDVGEGLAAPYCTKMMASFGAEVIKIEPPAGGDELRRTGPFLDHVPNQETSAPFLYLNTGKKGITLDLKAGSGVETFKKLAAKADVIVEDSAPGFMAELGLGYDVLESINPGLLWPPSRFSGSPGLTGSTRRNYIVQLRGPGGCVPERRSPAGKP